MESQSKYGVIFLKDLDREKLHSHILVCILSFFPLKYLGFFQRSMEEDFELYKCRGQQNNVICSIIDIRTLIL
jgi:hypothetical protein